LLPSGDVNAKFKLPLSTKDCLEDMVIESFIGLLGVLDASEEYCKKRIRHNIDIVRFI
jgi:hypothetical protein